MRQNETRTQMVLAAIDLFHAQGVNATSVDQILNKSGTGKSQFTHYFKNKEGLVLAAIEYLHEIIESGSVSTGYTITSWRELDSWFENFIVFQRSVGCARSCPIGTIGGDIAGDQTLLRKAVRKFLEWSRQELAKFFSAKIKAGELPSRENPIELADFFIALMQGGMLLTKMKRETDMFENASRHARNYIKLLRMQMKN